MKARVRVLLDFEELVEGYKEDLCVFLNGKDIILGLCLSRYYV